MSASKFILLNKIPQSVQDDACRQALEYALFSLPFTVNRMAIDDINKRLENIVKGKIAEQIMLDFLIHHAFQLDIKSCETPYYLPDKRDFLLDNYEWDIKNNFLNIDDLSQINDMKQLPALIPNRFDGDQWSKRLKLQFENKKSLICIFTFMPNKTANGAKLFNINLNSDQEKLLKQNLEMWAGSKPTSPPFEESDLRKLFTTKQSITESIRRNTDFQILITAIAGANQWKLFENKPPSSFVSGIIKTRITNQFCEVGKLPSFYELFASKFNKLNWGALL